MIGRKIKLYRLQQGLTKQELAEKSGISQAMLTAFEEDNVTLNIESINIAHSIATALNVTFPQLMSYIPCRPNGQWKSAQSYLAMCKEEYLDKLYLVSEWLDNKQIIEQTLAGSIEFPSPPS